MTQNSDNKNKTRQQPKSGFQNKVLP